MNGTRTAAGNPASVFGPGQPKRFPEDPKEGGIRAHRQVIFFPIYFQGNHGNLLFPKAPEPSPEIPRIIQLFAPTGLELSAPCNFHHGTSLNFPDDWILSGERTVRAILRVLEATVYGGKPVFMNFFTVSGNGESLAFGRAKFAIMPPRKWIKIHINPRVARKRLALFDKPLCRQGERKFTDLSRTHPEEQEN
jgi:hypothetical protein